MYRLCKLFISDVTAGDNLLRNAFVPINRESGIADHGVLFAANGTCKTTLLSFILSIFSPEQRRFVQHLQSTGDKTLEQYLIPGRPAVVLVDLACNEQPTLFDSAPEAHLVLGQLLYRSRGMADKVDRIFFIAHSPDFFDQLRTAWDSLQEQEQPWRSIRDFISQHVQQTTLQNEWLSVLERLGLDPWLIDRQIDFARSEGGIKDAFKFRSESEFLNFFLGCVTDLDAAETLRKNIGQSLRKMEDRPRKITQLETARELKKRLLDYNGIARIWREARGAIDDSKAVLGEAVHLLQHSKELAEQKIQQQEEKLQQTENEISASLKKQEIAKINSATVERFQLSQATAQAEKKISQAEEEIQLFKVEKHGLKAADLVADIRRNRGQVAIKRDVLRQAGEELSPLLERIAVLSLQYHARLDEDRRGLLELVENREAHIRELDTAMISNEGELKGLLRKRSSLEEQRLELNARMRAAQERRQALPMEAGELPEDALKRLQDKLQVMEKRITAVSERRTSLEKEIGANNERWLLIQKELSELNLQHKQARQQQEAEQQQRQSLLASAHLQRVAGSTSFDPTSAELVSRFDDALTRKGEKLEQQKQQRGTLTSELERLRGTETLTADPQTKGLLAHYYELGIKPDDLKTFPEYLAGYYTDPEDIARYIESDPGRFTGFMATTQNVLETVLELPVPDWLHRPIILSTLENHDDLHPIASSVICPKDPGVYSKRYLEETRARLQDRLDALKRTIESSTKELREMEEESRVLHAYRKSYPDALAVAALSERLEGLDQRLDALKNEIIERETQAAALRGQKSEQEAAHYELTTERVRLSGHHDQIQRWLKEYESLESWGHQAEEINASLKTLASNMETETESLQRMREEVGTLKTEIQVSRSQIKGLDERAGEVPKAQDRKLSAKERKEALKLDRENLKKLFEEARDHQRHQADTLGIRTVQRELDELETTCSHQEAHLASLLREVAVNDDLIENWVGKSATQREERRNELTENIQELTGVIGRLRASIEYQTRDIIKLDQMLAQSAAGSIVPDIRESELIELDLDGMLQSFQHVVQHCGEDLERLELRGRELEAALKELESWRQETVLGLAASQAFEPLWDEQSPRSNWPQIVDSGDTQEHIEAARTLNTHTREGIATFEEQRQALESTRGQLGTEFERLRSDLAAERFMNLLPAVIDELLRYDTESLGAQATELIQRCEEIAQNIEGDLSISQQIMDNLVDMLLSRAKEYHQKLQTAAQQVLPEDVYIYGGKNILRAGTRLDFTRFGEDFKRTVENWLHELMQQERLPEVNQRAGNCLGSELLYQLLRASTGKKDFGIRLLKCDDTGRNYEQVGKDLGSGGEALTTAVLLYTLLTFMRKKRHNHPHGRLPAFLILDNPLGVCNRSDFLDAQLKVARAMGIQCVYLTGINDRESLGLFELRVAIRKGEKKARIGKKTYTILEIAELNVEHTAIPVLA